MSIAPSITPPARAVDARYPLRPTGALSETMPRVGVAFAAQAALTSGQASAWPVYLYAGERVSSITFVSSSTAAGTPTNQWFALAKADGTRVGITNDDGATAWAVTTAKTLNLATPYDVPTDGVYFILCMVTATTVPTLLGANGTASIGGIAPVTGAKDTTHTGLTNPASAPGTFTFGFISQVAYGFVS